MMRLKSHARRNIVFIHPSDELYGADRVLIEIVRGAPVEVETEVWLPNDVDYPRALLTRALQAAGVKSRKTDLPILRRAIMRPKFMPRLVRDALVASVALWRSRPRVVYLNTSATLLLAPAARLAGSRVVLHLHEAWTPAEAKGLGLLGRCVHQVVCVSEDVMARLPARLRAKAVVVYNGIPVPADDAQGPRPHDNDVVGFVVASRWNLWKGLDVLLQAWAAMPSRVDRRLVVLGGPPVSGAAVNVPQLVIDLGISDSVEIVGEQDDPWPWILSADCVVVPSVTPDPLPTIAIEAAGVGIAVLASATGGLPEIIEHGVTGRLVEAGDVTAWSGALAEVTLVSTQGQGRAARLRYEKLFHPDIFRRRMSDLLWSQFAGS